MSWRVTDGPRPLKLTRKLAAEFAALPAINRDRPLSQLRLQRHRQALDHGQFRNPEWATALCKEDGVEYRVNGRHTSTLLSDPDVEIPADLKAIVTHYECDTHADVAALWATFDSKNSTRTARDIYNTFAGSEPELDELNTQHINIIAAGLGLAADSDKGNNPRISAEDKGEMLLRYKDFVLWASSLLSPQRESRLLARAPVIGAMFDSWAKSQTDARKFWHLVKSGEGVPATTPDRRLQKFLLETSIAVGKSARNLRASSQKEVYVRCIHAWNSFRTGRPSELKFFAEARVPKAV